MYAAITGASSGIGKEIAKLLAEKGYDLIISARREERLINLKKEIESNFKVNVVVATHDLSLYENAVKLHDDCQKYDVSVLINNAGFGKIGFLKDIPIMEELSMINTNIVSLYVLTKLFSASMKSGYILNVASSAGFSPQPGMAVYGATKAFVLNLSEAVRYELKKQNKDVHISTLCPGPVDTEFNDVAKGSFTIKSLTAKKCALSAVKGLFKRKNIIIPGVIMKVARISKFLPSSFVISAAYNIQKNKAEK